MFVLLPNCISISTLYWDIFICFWRHCYVMEVCKLLVSLWLKFSDPSCAASSQYDSECSKEGGWVRLCPYLTGGSGAWDYASRTPQCNLAILASYDDLTPAPHKSCCKLFHCFLSHWGQQICEYYCLQLGRLLLLAIHRALPSCPDLRVLGGSPGVFWVVVLLLLF